MDYEDGEYTRQELDHVEEEEEEDYRPSPAPAPAPAPTPEPKFSPIPVVQESTDRSARPDRPDRPAKSDRLCRNFNTKRGCVKGDDCNFRHAKGPCAYFNTEKGCVKKDCAFLHERGVVPPKRFRNRNPYRRPSHPSSRGRMCCPNCDHVVFFRDS